MTHHPESARRTLWTRSFTLTWFLTSSLTLASIAAMRDAVACGNGIEHRIDRQVGLVAGAETLLNRGKPELAAKQVLNAYPSIKRSVPGRSRIHDRGLQILATAIVRLDGNFQALGFRDRPKSRQRDNLRWSAHTLQALQLHHKSNPTLDTALAEAWAKEPQTQAEALTALTTLESEDRMASPHGFSALARLRRSVAAKSPSWLRAPLRTLGEGRAALAEARCKQMSRGADYCASSPVG